MGGVSSGSINVTKDTATRFVQDKLSQCIVTFDKGSLRPQSFARRRCDSTYDDVSDLAFGMATHDMDYF
jgi:hypothetical protein